MTCSIPHDPSVLSPLQSKAVLIFEFIKTRRVLSNREIPSVRFQDKDIVLALIR